ncbi:MAG TPA: hypothetical protein VJT54_05895 [Verrucomicrobiae bacterium]|nr:hypothetical protein [Verrucomicrobiae bacterium]
MKMKFFSILLLSIFTSFTGCDRSDKAATQSQIGGLQTQVDELQRESNELTKSNLTLQGRILELQDKVKSSEQINAVLKQQLESVNLQLNKYLEISKANAEQEKDKPIEETIRAFRKFNSIVSASITFDEYRQKLQDLKVALDENSPAIESNDIAKQFQDAYADYQDAFVVWGASLGQDLGDFEAAMKRHGLWSSQIPEDKVATYQANYESLTNMPNALRVPPPLLTYNYDMLKYDVSPCLQACSSSAMNVIDDVERKIREQKP